MNGLSRAARPGANGWPRATLLAMMSAATAVAGALRQTVEPPTLPPEVAAALAEIEDFRVDFHHPAFYALRDHVASSPAPDCGLATAVENWGEFLESPTAFRGRWVRVSGVVGRNKAWRLAEASQPADPIWQLELARAGQSLAITAVLTQPGDDLPLGSEVELCGWFVMIRQYSTERGGVGRAALLVAPGPTAVRSLVSPRIRPRSAQMQALGFGLALCGGLILAWVLVRGWVRRSGPGAMFPATPDRSRENLAQDFNDWAHGTDGPRHADEGERR